MVDIESDKLIYKENLSCLQNAILALRLYKKWQQSTRMLLPKVPVPPLLLCFSW